MKKKLLAMLLAAALVFSLLPGTVFAAEPDLPDWYFLVAIFKNVDADVTNRNGVTSHIVYTMPQEEVDSVYDHAEAFKKFLNETGVMNAHMDVVEINTPVTQLREYPNGTYGSYLSSAEAAPLLEGKVDLDRYDHVSCIMNLNVSTGYMGVTGTDFKNGTGQSCINNYSHPVELTYIHEFLHFMERMSKKWGAEFNLHGILEEIYPLYGEDTAAARTDIFLNRIDGDAGFGTGVSPAVWPYPPHVLRTTRELNVPDGVTSISNYAFQNLTNLEKIIIPASVISIGYAAFYNCVGLRGVTILAGVADIGDFAFRGCGSLKSVTIPASVTKIGSAAFYGTGLTDVYYGGTEEQWKSISLGDYNSPLTKANIHFNRTAFSDVPANEYYTDAVLWAVGNGVTSGTGDGTTFSPKNACSRAEIVTFLWRAYGRPEPGLAENPFSDVRPGDYYYEAVLWAVENGVTSGTGDGTTFSPNSSCTRKEAVTFLYRAANKPPVTGGSSFTDVPADEWYADAVAWASENNITSGTGNGTTFSPDQTCTRDQIVTFLYRELEQ